MSEVVGKSERTLDAAYFCPSCGSPTLESEHMVGAILAPDASTPVSCRACKWTGTRQELAAVPILHEFTGSEEMVRQMVLDLRRVLVKTFTPTFGPFLLKWGFLDQPVRTEQLGRYTVAVVSAVMRAVIAEKDREMQEKFSDPTR